MAKGQTKELLSSGVISTAGKSAIIWAITLMSGTTASSCTLSDGGSGGTTKWCISWAATTAAGDASVSITFPYGLICSTDAYGTIVGTDAKAYVLYDEIA